jgi:DNA polymerase-3 subunit gamma/tau
VVEAVKGKRRLTWIHLSQHAQVVALDGRTLTLGFNNAGARESFVNGRSDTLLQQVLIDLIGQDWRIEAIVDPAAQPGVEPPVHVTRPAVPQDASATTDGPPAAAQGMAPPSLTEDAERDDPDADDALDTTGLLTERLGAQVIEEIPRQ